jgi:hypothetical protein
MTQTAKKRDYRDLFIDPEMIRRVAAETDAKMGIVPGPTLTAEEIREMMIAEGVRPEDCIGSRGIIEERYGTLEQPEEIAEGSTAERSEVVLARRAPEET